MATVRELSERAFGAALKRARRAGKAYGRNAAAWWEQDAIGGRAPNADVGKAREVLEDHRSGGDKLQEWIGEGPSLSGEWADGPNAADVVNAALPANWTHDELLETDAGPETADELATAWLDAAQGAYVEECERLLARFVRDAKGGE